MPQAEFPQVSVAFEILPVGARGPQRRERQADALGEKRGIERFGTAYVTMDEAMARTIIDLSGRSYFVFHAEFSREIINGFALEMVQEFFRAVATEGRINLHIALLYGTNAHHQAEAIFKSFGRALRAAVATTGNEGIPSTKGTL